MVKDIVKYPTPLSVQYATDVRIFDEELFSLIEDLKDTMNKNNLNGLAAFQIGNYYNVIVIKNAKGEFIEMINPRLISHSNKITTEESTAYYPSHTAPIERYENISVVFQDKYGNDKSMQASGDLSILIQRKIDYTFGATFMHKMSKVEKEKFENRLEYGATAVSADYCPTTFKRDKIIKVMNVIMALMALAFVSSLFIQDKELISRIWSYLLYGSLSVVFLDIVYFFYAQYEGKKFTSCTSCQIGNIIGTAMIVMLKLSVIMLLSYLLLYK